jgi:hypothetical protein
LKDNCSIIPLLASFKIGALLTNISKIINIFSAGFTFLAVQC